MPLRQEEGCGFSLALTALNIFSFTYDVLTFPIYFLIQNPIGVKWRQKQTRALVIDSGQGYVTYKSTHKPSKHHLELIDNNIDSMVKMFDFCSEKHQNLKCLGTREILAETDEVQSNGRIFKKFEMGEYKWKTYAEVNKLATHFGRGMREFGNKPLQNIAIFAETRAEWMIAAHGLFKQKMPIVTIYATLGDEAIAHALNETEVMTIITSFDLLSKFKKIVHKTPFVKCIIYMEDQLKTLENSDGFNDVNIIKFGDVLQKGEKSEIGDQFPSGKDLAVIMYTSGSTGIPKGVMLLHENLIGTLKGFSDLSKFQNKDVMMGYLPLAHVFELLVENVCMFIGVPVGYSGALTMTDTSSKIKKGCKGDATILRPTVMTAVPLILDRISKGIQEKVSKAGFLTRLLFLFAYNYKVRWQNLGMSTPIINRVVFGAIKRIVGGNLNMIISGGAPLTSETHEKIRTCLCINLLQGYGLTETTSCATCQDEYDTTFGRVGHPMSGISIKLLNWEEGNYRVTDKPYPRGEIVIGGPNISAGYYKQPEKTKEEFSYENGQRWFKTGDIGEVQKDGVLKIIDRKKDLVKLQAGEYVSLGKVESQLKTCQLVDNICVYGDSTKNYCIALISPNPEPLKIFAKKAGIADKTFQEMCADPELEKAVLQEIMKYGKDNKLEKFEIPIAIKLVSEPWTPESGLVTAAFKIKRKDIQERYKDYITWMYK